MRKYVVLSLETHLFFCRIMKEHSLFLLASFPSVETEFREKAKWHMEKFEEVLESAVRLADGSVRENVLCSGEVVTEFTQMAEHQTQNLTGIPINMRITEASQNLKSDRMMNPDRETVQRVRILNQNVIRLLDSLIELKGNILSEVAAGNLFTTNYPLLVEHILREAKWYQQMVMEIENGRIPNQNDRSVVLFWNQIMMEHAQFIRGLLDPAECDLIDSANDYADEFCKLLELAREQDCRLSEELTRRTMEMTEQYRNFKSAGTDGITQCQIRSVIVPLLADHVLREANYYLRLLNEL